MAFGIEAETSLSENEMRIKGEFGAAIFSISRCEKTNEPQFEMWCAAAGAARKRVFLGHKRRDCAIGVDRNPQ